MDSRSPHSVTQDTIAAIATAWGEAGIAIVRLSGPEARRLADRDSGMTMAPSWDRDTASSTRQGSGVSRYRAMSMTRRLMRQVCCWASALSRPSRSERVFMMPRRAPLRKARSAAAWTWAAAAAVSASSSSSSGQGLSRKRNTSPVLTAAMAARRSAWPVSMMRMVSGAARRSRPSKDTPSRPGMRRSETTTA
ncbi:MAG: hypothetical protein EOM65_10260 [Synergistales bacterium]|nr:hypothetical protein [Synergistales bacterium]